MTSLGDKVDYVKRAGQTRKHECHWPGCTAQVPPAMWGCSRHWYALPIELRRKIWRCYRLGQEITLMPSRDYVEAAREVQAWIAEHGAEALARRASGGSKRSCRYDAGGPGAIAAPPPAPGARHGLAAGRVPRRHVARSRKSNARRQEKLGPDARELEKKLDARERELAEARVLGVATSATIDDIRQAYKLLVKQNHP